MQSKLGSSTAQQLRHFSTVRWDYWFLKLTLQSPPLYAVPSILRSLNAVQYKKNKQKTTTVEWEREQKIIFAVKLKRGPVLILTTTVPTFTGIYYTCGYPSELLIVKLYIYFSLSLSGACLSLQVLYNLTLTFKMCSFLLRLWLSPFVSFDVVHEALSLTVVAFTLKNPYGAVPKYFSSSHHSVSFCISLIWHQISINPTMKVFANALGLGLFGVPHTWHSMSLSWWQPHACTSSKCNNLPLSQNLWQTLTRGKQH